MEQPGTFSKGNSLEEYATLMAMTASGRKNIFGGKSLQHTGLIPLTASAYGTTVNLQVNPTNASKNIIIQRITKGAEDTLGLGVSLISQGDITSTREATETLVRYGYVLFGLPFGNLGYPIVQFSYQLGPFVLEPTPTLKELLNGPLFQVAGMFEINEPGWADKHDEYTSETYF